MQSNCATQIRAAEEKEEASLPGLQVHFHVHSRGIFAAFLWKLRAVAALAVVTAAALVVFWGW